jgi:hypothetical protein
LQKVGGDAAYRDRLAKLGADPSPPLGTAHAAAFLKSEIERWAKVVKAANIKVE